MGVVLMLGGPKDDRTYDYPDPLPKVLTFQYFDGFAITFIDYRRQGRTRHYRYIEPS